MRFKGLLFRLTHRKWPGWKPIYVHDCDACIFITSKPTLTSSRAPESLHLDVYYCPSSGSLVARYGNDGPEYFSDQVTEIYKRKVVGGTVNFVANHGEVAYYMRIAYNWFVYEMSCNAIHGHPYYANPKLKNHQEIKMIDGKCPSCGENGLLMNEDAVCRMCETKKLMSEMTTPDLKQYILSNTAGWPRKVREAAAAELAVRELIS
jgi:hypothetical protein